MKRMIACALYLTLMLFSLAASAQQQTVSGIVKDALGNPVGGVSVTVKGANRGTTTDEKGGFSILVANKDVLVFNHIGMTRQEFPASRFVGSPDKAAVAIVMVDQITDLEDVVVVGYGTQKKSVTTGAISKVKASDLTNMPVVRLEDALQGRTSGVTIAFNSGQPGSAATVRVRGITTLNNNNPLWVVDGTVIDNGGIGFLNQSDIESIEVLKDAASQAIYGARAATGVILVTTKKGKAGKLEINYNGFYGVSEPAKKLDLLDATQYATLRNEAATNAGKAAPFANPSQYGKGTDWQETIFNSSAKRQTHELNLSGGNERSTFFLSGGYQDLEGIVATDISGYKRYTIRLNSIHKLGKYVTFGQNAAYAHDKSKSIGNTNNEFGGPLSSAIALDPITPAVVTDPTIIGAAPYNNKGVRRDANGNPYGLSPYVQQEMSNPLAFIQTRLGNYSWSDNIVANAYIEVAPIKGLKIRSTVGTKLAFFGGETFTPISWFAPSNKNEITRFNRTNNRRFDYNIENTISYTRSIDDHNFTILAGQGGYMENRARMSSTTFTDIPVDNFNDASLNFKVPADKRNTDASEGNEHRVSSLFGRLNYDYEEKYLAQLLVRRDGSSRFAPKHKFGVFPSFLLGWVATKETFFPTNAGINFLKIRGGYGVVGNDNIGDFAYISTVGDGRNYAIGTSGSYIIGYSPNAPSNPELKWEETSQTNIGFDAVVLGNLSITFDWFKKETKDILQNPRIPGYMGAIANPASNIGTVRNTGVELELGWNKKFNDFTLGVSGNASWMKNEVVFLGNNVQFITAGQSDFKATTYPITRTMIGAPIGAFFGFKTMGVFQNQAEIDAYKSKAGTKIQPNAKPGDFKWQDTDGSGVIDEKDRVVLGNPTPTWNYGFNITLGYKGFDLLIFGQGVAGNKIFQGLRRLDVDGANWQTKALGRWTGEGTSYTHPRLTQGDPNSNGNFTNPSDFYLENGGYFRMKTLQLGYSLPVAITKKAGINKVRVYVMAQNLFTVTEYTGFDPEIGGGTMSIDRGIYPQARSYMMGINIGI